jgi:hypothetical protein
LVTIGTCTGQARVLAPAGQRTVCGAPLGPVMVSVAESLASGRQMFTSLLPARHIVPLCEASMSQIVGGVAVGTIPALRTAPIRARRPLLAWTV